MHNNRGESYDRPADPNQCPAHTSTQPAPQPQTKPRPPIIAHCGRTSRLSWQFRACHPADRTDKGTPSRMLARVARSVCTVRVFQWLNDTSTPRSHHTFAGTMLNGAKYWVDNKPSSNFVSITHLDVSRRRRGHGCGGYRHRLDHCR